MKIESGRGVSQPGAPKRAGASGQAGFVVNIDGPAKATAAAAASAAHSIDALLALQAEGQPGERRARQLRRGRDALDALAELERGLVFGHAPGELRQRLERLKREGEPTGEPGLDAILVEIDTRVAVELAKLEMSLGRS
jgi:hypothetical protein